MHSDTQNLPNMEFGEAQLSLNAEEYYDWVEVQ